ncbi:SCO2400 family protein [Streptomyces verrucosisporus]|uniref:SCO2400 family protein n=1 Tax=Streptomyces verrucosisporus TaxID=1695161 RepID=UPI003FD8A247
MTYCVTCRRHLNGALSCPGCGTPSHGLAPVDPSAGAFADPYGQGSGPHGGGDAYGGYTADYGDAYGAEAYGGRGDRVGPGAHGEQDGGPDGGPARAGRRRARPPGAAAGHARGRGGGAVPPSWA